MAIYIFDVETFYDRSVGYSLTHMSTEDYVADDRFEHILSSVRRWDKPEPSQWFSGSPDETQDWLKQFEFEKHVVVGHHMRFDATVLAMRYGIHPKVLLCTEYMANPFLKVHLKSLRLEALAEYFGLPPKGKEVWHNEGRRRLDFSPAEMEAYAEYCMHDDYLCGEVFARLRPRLSADELNVISMTLQMYTRPQMVLDVSAFETGLRVVRERKEEVLADLEIQGITKKKLGSNPQFAQILRDRGIEPPIKESPAWLKKPEHERDPEKRWTYAFGKTDPAFLQLKEDYADDLEISVLLNARTETKSVQEETRCEKFAAKGRRHHWLRAPVVYASTHTGRYGGDEGENVLNLTNVGKFKDKLTGETKYKSYLRFGFAAPPDHDVVAIDYSQIEARIAAVTAGEVDLVAAFREGRDIYAEFASELYGRPVSKELADVDPQAERDRKSGKETILGGDFGMGWRKFKATVRGKGLVLSDEEAMQVIEFFRRRYPGFPVTWEAFSEALKRLIFHREDSWVGQVHFIWDDADTAAVVRLDGMKLYYPGLRAIKNKETGEFRMAFKRARDKNLQWVWGGVIMNNWCQSNAGVLIRRAMNDIKRELGYRPALQVYDELIFVVPKSESADFLKEASALMTRPWDLMPDLPIAVEGKIGPSYGHV